MEPLAGQTISIPVTIFDSETNQASDPTTLVFTILKPDGSMVSYTDPAPEITHSGTGVFALTVDVDQPGRWYWQLTTTGIAAGYDSGFIDAKPQLSGDLISLDELKDALGIPLNQTGQDDKLSQAISSASAAVVNYTDRDFGSAGVTGDRIYQYDGSGYLEIDDATAVNSVTVITDGPEYAVDATEWRAQPYNDSVKTYIQLLGRYGVGSPEMGFTRNLDVYIAEGRYNFLPTLVRVNAVWGWPYVPDDVKQAVVWIAASMSEQPGLYVSESIEGYSRSTSQRTPPVAIPERAADILAAYQRIYV